MEERDELRFLNGNNAINVVVIDRELEPGGLAM
jgi:hypothetical protein